MSKRGQYIVIEGPDGTGKTTQATLLAERLNNRGIKSRYVHEPGETSIGLEIEKIIKNRHLDRSALTDLFLFTANRIEVYSQVIKPALDRGEVIIADRNWISSVAYQGVAGGLGIDTVRDVTQQWLPEEYVYPTFTALLYIPEEQHQKMLTGRGTSEGDYFEAQPNTFQQKIQEGYKLASRMTTQKHNDTPTQTCSYVSASGTIDEVQRRILEVLEEAAIL